ncbi:MAG: tetratricopeptide repeat protein [Halomonas sp.]|nr:tetratricopeptide repeat protein [Halomonas sp.]MBL1269213.1 tetratricopeptide repeat protein [Halomonas sp.]
MSNKKPNRSTRKSLQRSSGAMGTAQSLKKAKEHTLLKPTNFAAWRQFGAELSAAGKFQEAMEALEQSSSLGADDAETLTLKGWATYQLGDAERALSFLHLAIDLNANYPKAQHYTGYIYYTQGRYDEALPYAERACELAPGDVDLLNTLGNVLLFKFEYARARDVLTKAAQLAPSNFLSWNNLGNVHIALGDLDKAIKNYWKAHHVAPYAPGPFSNIITTYHYDPDKTGEEINELCKQWDSKYPPATACSQARSNEKDNKRLRIGLISDGFRGHPVGRMITTALLEVSKQQIAFYFYSTNNARDGITERLKTVAEKWVSVQPLKDEQVAEQIVNDEIDILIDLAGHNAGNRVLSVAMRPAPLQVKWVGGLINTTGVAAIDYLISDHIETPQGADKDYVEKLIRLPDDYICYVPPSGYEPDVKSLPALENGYITLGCFNNAIKINNVLLEQWAKIMLELPSSKLLLKSMQYKSEERRKKVINAMVGYGVEEERLLIEGPSPHAELLDAYNRVDIALDTWPYSGGLTTCESFLMGVPVVTMPGPTFAGRHSATHLINAGMPELVVSSWEEYRERVLELSSDLDSLATIRQHLRQVLLESPVCDAPRFARHFTDAMRAIWQRHCEGKQPAALRFDKTGQAKFADEEKSVDIVYAESMETDGAEFNWSLPSKIIVLDNGSKLVQQQGLENLRQLNAFGIVAFDPASCVENPSQFEGSDDVQVFPHAVLGNGNPATLYSCLDPSLSSTLEPLPIEQQYTLNPSATSVLAKLPINTIALNSIEGLKSLDWLILDDLSDATAILDNGIKALENTLIIQVRIAFQPTHRKQPNLAEIQHWMSRNGFRFYRFNDQQHLSHFPESVVSGKRQATELKSADALFIPSHARMTELNENQCVKLAFLLHTVYGIKDMAYKLLAGLSESQAKKYLIEEKLVAKPIEDNPDDVSSVLALNKYFENSSKKEDLHINVKVLFFPDYSHANPYQKLLYSIFPQDVSVEAGVPWLYSGLDYNHKIFHVHWEDVVYRQATNISQAKAMTKSFMNKVKHSKADGWKMIWTVHNEAPHENFFPEIDNTLRNFLASYSDSILVHSHKAKDVIVEKFPKTISKIAIIPNGSYEGFYSGSMTRKGARQRLGISESCKVFLFFGNIRPYKGLDKVLSAFSKESVQNQNCILLIVGRGDARSALRTCYTGDERKIKLFNYEVSDADVQSFFAASDFSVFGFKKILNSSSVLLSYTFETPIIIPDLESLDEFKGAGKGALCYEQNDAHELESMIIECCNMETHIYQVLVENCKKIKKQYHWANFAPQTKRVIEKTLGLGSESESSSINELTILAFGKKASDVVEWKKNHQEIISLGYHVILAYSEGDVEEEIVKNKYGCVFVSKSHDEAPVLRIKKSLDEIETQFIILCASDDKLFFPNGVNLKNVNDDTVGYSGKVLFEDGGGASYSAQTNALLTNQDSVNDRLMSYWTFPFPADNSIFYSILRLEDFKKVMADVGSASCEALDWVLVTALLKIGKIEKADFLIKRDKTPSIDYTKNYLANLNDDSKEENPLDQAVKRIREVLTPQQYSAISDKIDIWWSIKQREVDRVKSNSLNQ